MDTNLAPLMILFGIIGFFLNLGICYVISLFINKCDIKRKKKDEKKEKKKRSKILEFLFLILRIIFVLGVVVAGCEVLGFGVIVFNAFYEHGIMKGLIYIFINILACFYFVLFTYYINGRSL